MSRVTYQDAVLHLVDYLGGNPGDAVQRDCKRAILQAYTDLANAQRWTYLLRHGRVITSAPYAGDDPAAPATLAYSAATNRATIAGGTWPAWTAQGTLRMTTPAGTTPDQALYRPARVLDPTTVQLDDEVNPGVDLPAGTAFSLYRDTYLLPADFVAADQSLYEQRIGEMEYVHPRDWLFDARYSFVEGDSRLYTFTGDDRFPGRLVMRVTPFPTFVKSIDFLYHRRPRPLNWAVITGGTMTIAAGSDTATFAGNGAMAPAVVAGMVLRISGLAGRVPTSAIGDNPAAFEAVVLDAPTATTLLLDAPAPATLAGLPYVLSDPIDLEAGAMLTAFWRCCEKHVAVGRQLKDKPATEPAYRQALVEAKQADRRSFAGRRVGEPGPLRQRLRDMPLSTWDCE